MWSLKLQTEFLYFMTNSITFYICALHESCFLKRVTPRSVLVCFPIPFWNAYYLGNTKRFDVPLRISYTFRALAQRRRRVWTPNIFKRDRIILVEKQKNIFQKKSTWPARYSPFKIFFWRTQSHMEVLLQAIP